MCNIKNKPNETFILKEYPSGIYIYFVITYTLGYYR